MGFGLALGETLGLAEGVDFGLAETEDLTELVGFGVAETLGLADALGDALGEVLGLAVALTPARFRREIGISKLNARHAFLRMRFIVGYFQLGKANASRHFHFIQGNLFI